MDLGSYDKALEYYHKALAAHEELREKSGVARVTGNIGSLFAMKKYEGYDATKAEEYLLKAIAMNTEIGAKAMQLENYKNLAELCGDLERWKEHSIYYKKYTEVEKEINLEEVKKQDEQREREKQTAIAIAAADARHQATQELLHNVLPPSIAHRMVEGEKLIAEKLPSVLYSSLISSVSPNSRNA